MDKTIVVTGGAGFIGSHLCHALIEMGNHVICVDNLYTGSRNNIKDLMNHDKFQFIHHNVIEPLSIEESIDQIFNLACPASPVHYQASPVFTIKTSVFGCTNMLELAAKKHATILQASTSEIYGDPLVHPQQESYFGNVNTIGIRSCYDEGKRVGETLFTDYRREYQVDTKIVRIFNTYGPHMQPNDGRVVSSFILQALKNQPITIQGSGEQTRSFCYISDQVRGLIALMNSDVTGPVNIGNPHEVTILDLAQLIIKLTNSKSELVYKPLPQDDPHRRKPDITQATTKLGWKPEVDWVEGIGKTIEYFRTLV